MSSIKRLALGIGVIPLVALGFLAQPAAAAQRPGELYRFDLAAGEACAFPIVVTGHDATVITTDPDGAVHTHGYNDALVTNPANGKHVFRVTDGPGDFAPNGTTLYARGAWIGVEMIPGHPVRYMFSTGTKYRVSLATGRIYKKSPDFSSQNICKLID